MHCRVYKYLCCRYFLCLVLCTGWHRRRPSCFYLPTIGSCTRLSILCQHRLLGRHLTFTMSRKGAVVNIILLFVQYWPTTPIPKQNRHCTDFSFVQQNLKVNTILCSHPFTRTHSLIGSRPEHIRFAPCVEDLRFYTQC